jgi:hypothetical protein
MSAPRLSRQPGLPAPTLAALGAIVLIGSGAGRFSLDAARGRTRALAGGRSFEQCWSRARRESCIKLCQGRIPPQILTFSGWP